MQDLKYFEPEKQLLQGNFEDNSQWLRDIAHFQMLTPYSKYHSLQLVLKG